VLGSAFLVGGIAVFDVNVLCRRFRDAQASARAAIPMAGFGIVILAASGPVLFAAEASAIGRNPLFQMKMALVLVGLINVCAYYWYRRRSVRDQGGLPHSATFHAVVSLLVWIGVLLSGRAIAYI
jgi:hypothetical protein